MEDTPSNYNIPNGRLDGKSLGLKAIFMHAQKMGMKIPEGQMQKLEEKQKNNLPAVQEESYPNRQKTGKNALNALSNLHDSSDASWQPGNKRFNGGYDESVASNMDNMSIEEKAAFGRKKNPIQKQF